MRYPSVESKILEFKERLNDYTRLLETVTAFANTQGGTIIIGIRDVDRMIIGLNDEELRRYSQEIPEAIADAISPQIAIDLYEQNFEGNVCVTIRVFPGPQQPYFLKRAGYPNGVFLRYGSHNRQADSYAMEQFNRTRQGRRYEQQPCPQIRFEDLSRDLLADLFVRVDPSVLIGTGYALPDTNGRTIPTVAGTLLFYHDHQNIIAESGITISSYTDESKRQLIQKQEFSGGIIGMLEQAFSYLQTLLATRYGRDGLVQKPIAYSVPLDAVREALVNAVAHRAYDYEAPTRITLFPDRIEFLNPGTFYAPINPDNLTEGLSRYRNPLIADALRKKGYMEKQGIGINLIIASCLASHLSQPQFIELEHHVKLVIFTSPVQETERGSVPDPYDTEALKTHFSALGPFTAREFAHYIGRSVSLAKKILFTLQQQGIVKMIGRGPATKYRFLQDSYTALIASEKTPETR